MLWTFEEGGRPYSRCRCSSPPPTVFVKGKRRIIFGPGIISFEVKTSLCDDTRGSFILLVKWTARQEEELSRDLLLLGLGSLTHSLGGGP